MSVPKAHLTLLDESYGVERVLLNNVDGSVTVVLTSTCVPSSQDILPDLMELLDSHVGSVDKHKENAMHNCKKYNIFINNIRRTNY